MKISTEKTTRIFFFLAAMLLVSVLIIFYYNSQRVKSTGDFVEHTQEVLRKNNDVLINILNIQTGLRGYLLTGREYFLEPYNDALSAINSDIIELEILTSDNSRQQVKISYMKKLASERLIFTNKIIELRRQRELNELETIEAVEKGKYSTDKMRSIVTDINKEEFRLLKERRRENDASYENSDWIFLLFLVFIVVILALVVILIKNQNTKNKIAEELQKSTLLIQKNIKEISAVNSELEAFSYSISHDLRAPLRAINGYAKILHEDYASYLDTDGISALNSIHSNSKKMGELIDALLAFSKLGRKQVTTSQLNMDALVKLVKEETANKSSKIEFTLHELLPAKGDQVLIKQVWVNLISNAIKYSNQKLKSMIEIGSYSKDNLVIYYVKDNGAGFDMQYYDKLFGVFQRLHSQEEFEGTGIGLAIVQKIIQRHNGAVWAESKLNEGTCFYFSLPAL